MGILSNYRNENPQLATLSSDQLAAHMYQQDPSFKNVSFEDFKKAVNYDEDLSQETGGGQQASLSEIGSAIGSGLSSAVDVFQESAGRAVRQLTGGISFEEDSFLDRFIKKQEQEEQNQNVEYWRRNKRVLPFTDFLTLGDLQQGLSQLGYSGAAATGGMLYGAARMPESPIVGAMTGAALTAGATTFLVDRDQFLSQLKDKLSQEDPNWSAEKWEEVKNAVGDDATLHGLWEAIPEAVGSALTAGIIHAPVGKIAESIPFIKEGITRTMVSAGIKLGAEVTEELGTEALTQLKQGEIEYGVGLRDKPLTSYWEALKEIAPQTAVMSAAMLGFGGALDKLSREGKVKSPKQVEEEGLPDKKKLVPVDPLDREISTAIGLEAVAGGDLLDKMIHQQTLLPAPIEEKISSKEEIPETVPSTKEKPLTTDELESAADYLEKQGMQEDADAARERAFALRKEEELTGIIPTEENIAAYQEGIQVPTLPESMIKEKRQAGLEERTTGLPSTAEESARIFKETTPTEVQQEAERIGAIRAEEQERRTGTIQAFEGTRETFTNSKGEGFATPAAVKAAMKKEGVDLKGYDIIQGTDKKWIGSPKSIQGLTPEVRREPIGLDNPDQALSYIESQIPVEDRDKMQDVFKQVRDARLHDNITFPQQLFNFINKTYESRTGKKLAYLTEESGPAAGMDSTPITGEDGRAYILEDLAAKVYKIGQTIPQFINALKGKLGNAYDTIKQRVQKLFQDIKDFHSKLGGERGSIPLMPEEWTKEKINKEDIISLKSGENLEKVQDKLTRPDNKTSAKNAANFIKNLRANRTHFSLSEIGNLLDTYRRIEDATEYRRVNIQEKGADAIVRIKDQLKNVKEYGERKLSKLGLWTGAWTLPMNAMLDMMDKFQEGRGFMHEIFYNTINRAVSKATGIIQERKSKVLNKMKELNLSVEDLTGLRETIDGQERSLQDMMYIWLGWNNPQTQIALKNMGISEEEYNNINANLNDNEKEFAREIQKDLESKWKDLAGTLEKIHGYLITEGLTPDQLKILKNTYKNIKTFSRVEHYLPMWGEGFETRADAESLVEELSGMRGTKRARISDKFKYERVEESHRPIRLDLLNIWDSAVNMQENFIHLSEPMKFLEKIYHKTGAFTQGGKPLESVSNLVKEKYGRAVDEAFHAYFDRVKNPNIYKQNDDLSRIGRFLRKNTALAYLGYNLVTTVKQIPSILYYLPYTSPSHLLRATVDVMSGKLKETLDFARADPQMRERMLERSIAELKENYFESEWGDKLLARFGKKGSQARRLVIRHAMDFIQGMDTVVTSIGYKAVYEYEVQRGATPEQARERALLATVNTQPATHAKDIPRLYATSEWLNMFLMFSNQLNKIWRMGSTDLIARGITNRELSKNQMMHGIALAAGAILINSIQQGFRAPKDKDDLGEAIFEGSLSSIPLMGGPMIKSWLGFQSTDTPLTAIPSKTMTAIKDSIDQGTVTEKEWSTFAESLALATGIPFSQPKRAWQALDKGDLKLLLGRRPTSRMEDDVKTLRRNIVNWKLTHTKEGKKSELREMARSIVALERQGETSLANKMTNRYFATIRTNRLSTSEGNRILMDARKSARKYLSELLTPEEWRKYKEDKGNADKVDTLLHYTEKINDRYYGR